jgi:transcriptional regulator with XRE-family HTH domain
MNLGDVIRSLRTSNGITQKELADKLSVSPSTIGMYEQGRRAPDLETITQIAKIFRISVDFLLGVENDNSDPEISDYYKYDQDIINAFERKTFQSFFDEEKLSQRSFISRLKKSIAEAELTEQDFIEFGPIGTEKAEAILKGEKEPSINDLLEISDFLKVTLDYLLCRTTNNKYREQKLVGTYIQLDEDNRDILMGHAKELLKKQKYAEAIAADETPQKMAK